MIFKKYQAYIAKVFIKNFGNIFDIFKYCFYYKLI